MILSRYMDIGTQGMNFRDRQKTRQLNLIALITTSTTLGFMLLYIFWLKAYLPAAANLILIFLHALTLLFSIKGKVVQGIYWIITIYIIQIAVFSSLFFPQESGFQFFYFVVPAIVILLFKKEDVIIKVFYILLTLFLFFFAELYYPRPAMAMELSIEINRILHVLSLFICFTGNIVMLVNYHLEIVEVERRLSEQAGIDPLTGIANRRAFYNYFMKLFSCSRRYEDELSLILIDIDHFKKVNDTYGHQAGDEVLIQMIREISKIIRDADMLARFGGEEFCLLLPRTSAEQGVAAAEKIRRRIEEFTTMTSTKTEINITISCGISSLVNSGIEDFDLLIQYADKALYSAKASGRNKCVVYSDSKSL